MARKLLTTSKNATDACEKTCWIPCTCIHARVVLTVACAIRTPKATALLTGACYRSVARVYAKLERMGLIKSETRYPGRGRETTWRRLPGNRKTWKMIIAAAMRINLQKRRKVS